MKEWVLKKILQLLSAKFSVLVKNQSTGNIVMGQIFPEENKHIEEYLDYYCGLPYPPRFAVLLKGQWGLAKHGSSKYREKLEKRSPESTVISTGFQCRNLCRVRVPGIQLASFGITATLVLPQTQESPNLEKDSAQLK